MPHEKQTLALCVREGHRHIYKGKERTVYYIERDTLREYVGERGREGSTYTKAHPETRRHMCRRGKRGQFTKKKRNMVDAPPHEKGSEHSKKEKKQQRHSPHHFRL